MDEISIEELEEQRILLAKDSALFDTSKYRKICCWRAAPHWAWCIYTEITSSSIKVAIILLFVLVAALLFAFSEEEDPELLHLNGVSLSYPLTPEIDFKSSKRILQAIVTIQDTTDNPLFPHPTFVFIQIEGSNDRRFWADVSHSWGLISEEEGGSEHREDFFITSSVQYQYYRWHIATNSEVPLAITFRYSELYDLVRYEVIIAAAILIGVYILIVFELLHRTISALLGSFVCIGAVSLLRGRPTFEEVIFWIDLETIGLLFGMMVMVGILSETGIFEWSAIKVYRLSAGNIWHLTMMLCVLTGFLSSLLDNVTTILLMSAITIRICKVLDIQPQPIVLACVMFSNIGGCATVIGAPPNIILVNDEVIATYVNFFTFSLHMIPGVLIVGLAALIVIYFQTRSLERQPHETKQRELEIWKSTLRTIKEEDEDERRVREQLEEYINHLAHDLENTPYSAKILEIDDLEYLYPIKNQPLLVSSCIVLGSVILLFFLHSWIDTLQLTLAWIAIIGCMIHLLVSGTHDVDAFLEKVELSTLLFFAGLFILMHGIAILGLLDWFGDVLYDLILLIPEGNGRLAGAVVLLMWGSAIFAAVIDNIPFTVAMVPIIVSLGESDLGLPMTVLVWSLSFGVCLGGNGSLIGASSNVVACGLLDKQGYHVSFIRFLKFGFPVMVASLTVATIYILMTHVLVEWH